MRDNVLNVTAVLSDGTIIKTGMRDVWIYVYMSMLVNAVYVGVFVMEYFISV